MSLLHLFGISDTFSGFMHFILYLCGGFFEIMFIVLVLNMAFSLLKSICLYFTGVKR